MSDESAVDQSPERPEFPKPEPETREAAKENNTSELPYHTKETERIAKEREAENPIE